MSTDQSLIKGMVAEDVESRLDVNAVEQKLFQMYPDIDKLKILNTTNIQITVLKAVDENENATFTKTLAGDPEHAAAEIYSKNDPSKFVNKSEQSTTNKTKPKVKKEFEYVNSNDAGRSKLTPPEEQSDFQTVRTKWQELSLNESNEKPSMKKFTALNKRNVEDQKPSEEMYLSSADASEEVSIAWSMSVMGRGMEYVQSRTPKNWKEHQTVANSPFLLRGSGK